jgi:hypothetical protein
MLYRGATESWQTRETHMQSRPFPLTLLAFSALIFCSSCSEKQQTDRAQQPQEREASSPPSIAPSAAPGIAFNYNYEFAVADERISADQEAHAAACEKLGLARCRITAMSYSVDQHEQVTAELDLKLNPMIARAFGKSALQFVESNDGKLVHLEIGSSDAGEAIGQATKRKNDVSSQIAQLQQELARSKPGTNAHATLLSQLQTLQQQASEETHAIESSEATLASTPMKLQYYGRGGVPGFHGNPVRQAWHTLVTTVVWLVGMLLQALAVLIPVGLVVAVFIAIWRTRPMRALRRWLRSPQHTED